MLSEQVAAADTWTGMLELRHMSGESWVGKGIATDTADANIITVTTGAKTLDTELTTVRLTTQSADTFDAGAVNVQWIY